MIRNRHIVSFSGAFVVECVHIKPYVGSVRVDQGQRECVQPRYLWDIDSGRQVTSWGSLLIGPRGVGGCAART